MEEEKTNKQLIEERLKEGIQTMKVKCIGCKHYVLGHCFDHNGDEQCWASSDLEVFGDKK